MKKLRWEIAQFVEIRWWQRYLKLKPPGDYIQWKIAYWNTFLENAGVRPAAGELVLDAGCGPAGIFTILGEQSVDAIDPLIDAYEEKLDHFKKKRYPYVSFFCRSLEDFQPEKSYDTIFCLNAINHVENMDTSLDKLVSCLRPGGKLVISIDAHNHRYFKHIFRLIPGDILHPHQYDLDEYREKLESRGLKVMNEVLCQERFLFNYYALVCRKAG
jgi:2-polyprenyl-6-hydroxyphenyl methylase/3-demethylubiquinone-9 3-methyltransferase